MKSKMSYLKYQSFLNAFFNKIPDLLKNRESEPDNVHQLN
ncbi:hypothetical protein NSP_39090 [Nodularia spumigena CCY9414]|nr:hypothetical protein NSP_39090 [Nodularia spumigena CCY9414]